MRYLSHLSSKLLAQSSHGGLTSDGGVFQLLVQPYENNMLCESYVTGSGLFCLLPIGRLLPISWKEQPMHGNCKLSQGFNTGILTVFA